MTLSIDNVVSISDVITPQGVLRRDFGIMLLITTDTQLGTGSNRVVVIPDSDAGAEVFAEDTEPMDAINILFQQTPYPKNLVVGRWINSDTVADLTGGTPGTLAAFQAINNGSFECKGEDFTTMDFSADTSFSEVADAIELKLNASADPDLTSCTVTYDSAKGAFVIATITTGVDADLTILSTTDPLVGTDISSLLAMDADSDYVLNQGADEETITEAINAIIALNDSPYFVVLDETITTYADILAISTWCATRRYMFAMGSVEAGALTTDEAATNLALLFALEPPRTWGTWSGTADYKALSAAGRLSSINFAQNNSLITMNLRQLPGTAADDITATQKAELDRKMVNYYVPLFATGSPGANAYMPGTTFKSGVWLDVRYWLDWIVNAIQVDVFNLLYASARVPQTEAGVTAIQEVIEAVCKQGVANGGIAPGTMSAANILDIKQTTGNLDFDGFLPKGYLIYAAPLSQQSQSDREQRKSPPFKVWLKGSGAIHFVEIDLVFEN